MKSDSSEDRPQQRSLERGETFARVLTEHRLDALSWAPPESDALELGVVVDT